MTKWYLGNVRKRAACGKEFGLSEKHVTHQTDMLVFGWLLRNSIYSTLEKYSYPWTYSHFIVLSPQTSSYFIETLDKHKVPRSPKLKALRFMGFHELKLLRVWFPVPILNILFAWSSDWKWTTVTNDSLDSTLWVLAKTAKELSNVSNNYLRKSCLFW